MAPEGPQPLVDQALSVSSDSGNSTASIKTDRTDEPSAGPASLSQPPPPSLAPAPAPASPISPQEKQQLEQLLSGLEAPALRQGFLSPPAGAGGGGGMMHLVPAQVHVNGSSGMDRETDILDDDLPSGSLGTPSSLEGRATPADLYDHPETHINGREGVTYQIGRAHV